MRDRVQAVGLARVPGDEDEVAVLRTGGAPLQVMSGPRGLAVLVGAEEADVEVVARVLEVVGVAAEEGDGELGGEDEPDVGVFLEGVEVVAAAVVERDDVAPKTRLVRRLLLDRRHRSSLGDGGGTVVAPRLDGREHAIGHILDGDQNVELEVGRFHLVGVGPGEEAVLVIVFLGGADLLKHISADVVVGHHQAVGRDERPRAAAVEPDGRRLQVLDPPGRRLEAIRLLQVLERQVVEDPHPLVGQRRRGRGECREDDQGEDHES